MTASEHWLDGTGGRIFARHWEPAGDPKANLVICHGVNSHGGQYLAAAETFADAGYAVTVLDLRGAAGPTASASTPRASTIMCPISISPSTSDGRGIRSIAPSCSATARAA